MIKPKILLMFSGGLDSTGVFWKLIQKNEPLLVHHLYLSNKENRTKAEEIAVKNIVDYMKKIKNFSYSESYHEYPSHNGNFMWDSDIYNFVAGTICISVRSIKEVAIGRTKSDAGFEQRAERGTKILNLLAPNVNKIYPVEDMTKKEVYKMLPENLRELTWSCRTPVYKENNIEICKRCKTCLEILQINRELNGI